MIEDDVQKTCKQNSEIDNLFIGEKLADFQTRKVSFKLRNSRVTKVAYTLAFEHSVQSLLFVALI